MTIPPFLAGVLCVIGIELLCAVTGIIIAAINYNHNHKGD